MYDRNGSDPDSSTARMQSHAYARASTAFGNGPVELTPEELFNMFFSDLSEYINMGYHLIVPCNICSHVLDFPMFIILTSNLCIQVFIRPRLSVRDSLLGD